MSNSAYTYLHGVFGGFTQRVGRESNGMQTLMDGLYRRFASRESLVEYYPWYLHPRDIAARIAKLAEESERAGSRLTVQLVGYSFGGQTAVNVACVLERSDVVVQSLELCEAVAREGRLAWIPAANPWAVIRVPRNVGQATWWRQRHRRWRLQWPWFFPAGHRVIAGFETVLYGPIELDCEHTEADNAPEFHRHVIQEAYWLHGGHDVVANRLPAA